MAEKRLPDFVDPGRPAFPQKLLKIDSSEISNATQSVLSCVESDSCIGKTGNNEKQEDSDDGDDADRSLLYCILLSRYEGINLSSTDWYEKLTNIRQTYDMKHRSREEDIRAIQSMKKTSHSVHIIGNVVNCYLFDIFDEDDRVHNCLTFNKDYEKFWKVTPTVVLRKCVPYVYNILENIMFSSEISDIVLNVGMNLVLLSDSDWKYDEKFQKCLKILNLPHAVVYMVKNDDEHDEFSNFKEYVDEIMKREHKSLESLNLNSLLGSYLIGRQTGKEKGNDFS
ncbi:uncharacterized protein LOC134245421 [Saccostrea cucullata]|uniref:uncharacterized protein LOC134245421 n=1 Tax=Saccostrea cuccullata TaxID=36930 RepID=UPI002ED04259